MSITVTVKQPEKAFPGITIEIDDWQTAALLCKQMGRTVGSAQLFDPLEAALAGFGNYKCVSGKWRCDAIDFRGL